MTTPSTALTTGVKESMTIVELMESPKARQAITAMLPEGQTYERVMREFFLAASDNPEIVKCEPASIIRAVSRAVSWDLVIGVTAFLVPRPVKGVQKLHAQQGYKGKIELMVRHRAARLVEAHCVYEKEHFVPRYGTTPSVEHHPIMDPAKRGELIGAYAYAKINAYDLKLVVMHREEVEQIRKEYSKSWNMRWENGTKVKINLDEIPWYLLKTCIHRLASQIPTSPKLAQLLNDDDPDLDDSTSLTSLPSGSAQAALPAASPAVLPAALPAAPIGTVMPKLPPDIAGVEYMPETGVSTTKSFSREEIREIAGLQDPYEPPTVNPDDPHFADSFPEDELPLDDRSRSVRKDALREGR